ncbi:MAG TPA: ABC transporter permease [Candidatus Eisenbacteria bacterium]|nr:ABC transporter permease [Candidatus Eisenbacteria bacterium]
MALQNWKVAIRVLWRSPLFTLTAIATIALGIGACTAIFSVTHAVLLQPLPYKDADRLVFAGMELRQRHVRDMPFSNADYIDMRDGTKNAFEDYAGVGTFRQVIVHDDGTPEEAKFATATTNFFRMLGGNIVVGRDFQEDDGSPQPAAAPGAPQPAQKPFMAILSYEYFRRRFGANASILGHTIGTTPGGPSPIVVGVLAPNFRLYFPPEAEEEQAPDIWIANRLDYDAANRNQFGIRAIGKLKTETTLERARQAVEEVAAETRKSYLISGTAGYHIGLEPLQQHMVARVRPAILALMGAAVFLMLIACANVANLLLVRASLRERELAVRAALGGNRWRLLVPLLIEATLLAAVGAAAGLALAWMGIRVLQRLAPEDLPRLDTIQINLQVLGFTAFACLAAIGIFGMLPAWRASRPGVSNLLRGSGRNAGLMGGSALRNVVVMAEVALSFVLLVGSGLMFRSFFELQHIDPGFDPHGLLIFQIAGTPRNADTPEKLAAFARTVQERLRSILGVESVTAANRFPFEPGFFPVRWGTEEAKADASKFQAMDNSFVLPGYFETMRIPLLEGRTFTDDDNLPKRDFVVVDDLLAKKAFHGQSAVGRQILIRVRTPEAEWVQIVGVVRHQRETSLAEVGREQVYFADAFVGSGATNFWMVRTRNDPANYPNTVSEAVRGVDSQVVVNEIQTGDALMAKAQSGTRFSLLLIGVFATVAGLLAGIGLYGVLATTVRHRTAEIGVRMALGAEPSKVFQLVVSQGFRLSLIGIGCGLVAAFGLTKLMKTMLVGVRASDPVTYVAMVLLFLLIAALSSWIPARRAAALDPVKALREE